MTIEGMVICKSVMNYQIMNVTSALLARGFQGNINYFFLGFWPVINPCCIKRTVYRLEYKNLCTRGLMGSTDQADPSCFYFGIIDEMMLFLFFLSPRFSAGP